MDSIFLPFSYGHLFSIRRLQNFIFAVRSLLLLFLLFRSALLLFNSVQERFCPIQNGLPTNNANAIVVQLPDQEVEQDVLWNDLEAQEQEAATREDARLYQALSDRNDACLREEEAIIQNRRLLLQSRRIDLELRTSKGQYRLL